MNRRPAAVVALATLSIFALTGCGDTPADSTSSAPAVYATTSKADLMLSKGWVSAVASPMPGMTMSQMPSMGRTLESAAYATITNAGPTPDALMSVSTPAAGSATLHATRTSANGSSGTMVAVAGIPVPAGRAVALRPGGFHVMLADLKVDYTSGSTIPMTWTFRSGTVLTTAFPVIDIADRPEPSDAE